MHLPGVENNPSASGPCARQAGAMRAAGIEVPQILHLFAFKPELGAHLERFAEVVMRGPSPLSAGKRELLAAFTSKLNHCPF